MTVPHLLMDAQTRLHNIQPKDIKDLIIHHGKIKESKKELTLKDPLPTNPHLNAIISDPYFEVKSIDRTAKGNEHYYDVSSKGRSVRVKISCKTTKH